MRSRRDRLAGVSWTMAILHIPWQLAPYIARASFGHAGLARRRRPPVNPSSTGTTMRGQALPAPIAGAVGSCPPAAGQQAQVRMTSASQDHVGTAPRALDIEHRNGWGCADGHPPVRLDIDIDTEHRTSTPATRSRRPAGTPPHRLTGPLGRDLDAGPLRPPDKTYFNQRNSHFSCRCSQSLVDARHEQLTQRRPVGLSRSGSTCPGCGDGGSL
jgi:hypothetical protein